MQLLDIPHKIKWSIGIVLVVFITYQVVASTSSFEKPQNQDLAVPKVDTIQKSYSTSPPIECHGHSCVTVDGKCVGDSLTNCTDSHLCCATGLFCLNGKCKENNFGDSCVVKNSGYPSCVPALISACVDSKCKEIFAVNDPCDADHDCAPGLRCSNGTCQGNGVGEPCNKNLSELSDGCAFGLMCGGNNTCIQLSKEREECNATHPCVFGTFCSTENYCQPIYTLRKDIECTGPFQCDAKMWCFQNKCQMAPAEGFLAPCRFHSDCSDGLECQCQGTSSYCVPNSNTTDNPSYSLKATKKYLECAVQHNCSLDKSWVPRTDTCLYTKCHEEYQDINKFECKLQPVKGSAEDTCIWLANEFQCASGFGIIEIVMLSVVAVTTLVACFGLIRFFVGSREKNTSSYQRINTSVDDPIEVNLTT